MKFHEASIRAMMALGVPLPCIRYMERSNRCGKTYAREVAKVLGRTTMDVLYKPLDSVLPPGDPEGK